MKTITINKKQLTDIILWTYIGGYVHGQINAT